jgi:hypothetical protein
VLPQFALLGLRPQHLLLVLMKNPRRYQQCFQRFCPQQQQQKQPSPPPQQAHIETLLILSSLGVFNDEWCEKGKEWRNCLRMHNNDLHNIRGICVWGMQ